MCRQCLPFSISHETQPVRASLFKMSGEWRVRLHVNGRALPDADAFEPDRESAIGTARAMVERAARIPTGEAREISLAEWLRAAADAMLTMEAEA